MSYTYATSNRHSIGEKKSLYRPAVFDKVGVNPSANSGMTAVFHLAWHRGRPAQRLLVPMGEDWISILEYARELSRVAWSSIGGRDPSPILIKVPTRQHIESGSSGVSLGAWDVLSLARELHRIATLFQNGGRAA